MVPGMVLPWDELIVKQSAERRFVLQKLWVHTNSPPPSMSRSVTCSLSQLTHSSSMLLWIPAFVCAMQAMCLVPGQYSVFWPSGGSLSSVS